MTTSTNAAAEYICKSSGWTATQLSLQKILYLAHMVQLGRGQGPLIPGNFEAWDYGPVHPQVYQKVKAFGSKPIPNVFWTNGVSSKIDRDTLDEACEQLLQRTPSELVHNTHWNRGAWAKHYVPGAKGIVIPEADIIDEYQARMANAAA